MNDRVKSVRNGICFMLSAALVLAMVPAGAFAAEVGAIKGTLVDANGQPLQGFKVRVTDAAGKSYESQATTENGQFELQNLPPGQYKYEIVDPSGKLVTVKIPPVQVDAGISVSQPIAIVPAAAGGGGGAAAGWVAILAAGIAGLVDALAFSGSSSDEFKLPSLTELMP